MSFSSAASCAADLVAADAASKRCLEMECRTMADNICLLLDHQHNHFDRSRREVALDIRSCADQYDAFKGRVEALLFHCQRAVEAICYEGQVSGVSGSQAATPKPKVNCEALRRHIIGAELSSSYDSTLQLLLDAEQDLDASRAAAVDDEIRRKTSLRSREFRLAAVEAEHRALRTEFSHLQSSVLEMNERLVRAHKSAQATAADVFSQFTRWDLLRRQLEHLSRSQKSLDEAVVVLEDAAIRGLMPCLPSSSAQRETIPSLETATGVSPAAVPGDAMMRSVREWNESPLTRRPRFTAALGGDEMGSVADLQRLAHGTERLFKQIVGDTNTAAAETTNPSVPVDSSRAHEQRRPVQENVVSALATPVVAAPVRPALEGPRPSRTPPPSPIFPAVSPHTTGRLASPTDPALERLMDQIFPDLGLLPAQPQEPSATFASFHRFPDEKAVKRLAMPRVDEMLRPVERSYEALREMNRTRDDVRDKLRSKAPTV